MLPLKSSFSIPTDCLTKKSIPAPVIEWKMLFEKITIGLCRNLVLTVKKYSARFVVFNVLIAPRAERRSWHSGPPLVLTRLFFAAVYAELDHFLLKRVPVDAEVRGGSRLDIF